MVSNFCEIKHLFAGENVNIFDNLLPGLNYIKQFQS